MSKTRFQALDAVRSRTATTAKPTGAKLAELFGSRVFTLEVMRHYVSEEVYDAVKAMGKNPVTDRKIADAVAQAMRSWAQEKGVTHYTHWFQPLTGLTAEKHDAFLEVQNGRPIETFSGSQLVQQEPDASSFPSGGIRATFEARGYTAWDPSSPAFIFADTLCIPSIYFSYNGEALDYKTPLLKSIELLNQAGTAVCQYFDRNVTEVKCTLGPEQEYFLIDKAFYEARPDLVLAGRTVFGAAPARGQQLEDHYFGSIPERVQAFMIDFEIEAMKLGIPLRTRHNEVAPSQFECAPQFEELNIAVDHNQILMDLMQKVAAQHELRALLHEKPFAGINGSGKHNNWSMSTNTGKNLLSPGKTPKDNLQFLVFFVTTLKAVHRYADILRAAIASAGNDFRLGANEAPPAIISAFIGAELTRVLDEFETSPSAALISSKAPLKLGLSRIPEVLRDNTDRNRTSPFAFTGNKFEFRAVGSTANNANAMTVLNTAVAAQLIEFKAAVDEKIKAGESRDTAIIEVLQQYLRESKAIRFEGNNYSEEWQAEAARRGLSNRKSTPEALGGWMEPASVELFTKHGIFTETELHARYEIFLENYIKKVDIEAKLISEIALTQIVPAVSGYLLDLSKTVEELQEIGFKKDAFGGLRENIETIAKHLQAIFEGVKKLDTTVDQAHQIGDTAKTAHFFRNEVFPIFDEVRGAVDALELLVDDARWPLPKYREMLFLK